MRISTFLSSSAFAVGLLLSSSLVAPVYAQKGLVYAPSTDWAINQIDGQGGEGGYCALARRFNQNTIVTLAQNSEQEFSFALDFQRPRFNTGQFVDITLDAGAGELRDFNVQPFSNKAFVVRLGRDASFMSALRRTGYLRAEVNGYSYGFDLQDIDTGYSQLVGCVTTMLPAPSVSPRVATAARPVVSSNVAEAPVPIGNPNAVANAGLEIQISALEDENNRLRTERTKLSQDHQQLKIQLQQTEFDYLKQIDDLRGKLTDHQRENDELRVSLANNVCVCNGVSASSNFRTEPMHQST